MGGSLTPTYTTNTNVGTASASASYAGDGNHHNATGSGTFEISKVSSTTTVECTGSPTFTGSPLTPCSVSVTGVNLTLTFTPTYANNTNAGTNTASASYTFDGDANHTGSSGSQAFSIAQAVSAIAVVRTAGAPYTYTGSPQMPCTAQATGAGMSPVNVTASLVYSNNTNAGSATANASWNGDANHTGNTGAGGFTIGKPSTTTTVTCPSAPQTYTGAPITPCTATVTGANLSLTPTPVYTSNSLGTATVSYAFAGDTNHTQSSDSKTFGIQYGWDGFLQPINDTAHTGLIMSNFKLGQTIPAKFVLKNAAGAVVQQATNPGFRWNYYGACTVATTAEAIQTIAPDSVPVFVWDAVPLQLEHEGTRRRAVSRLCRPWGRHAPGCRHLSPEVTART